MFFNDFVFFNQPKPCLFLRFQISSLKNDGNSKPHS